MKKIITTLLLIIGIFSMGAKAQSPDLLNYQAVVRNASGEVIANQDVSFILSIVQGSETGPVVYSESQQKKTNQFGLANLQIGAGLVLSGVMSSINWGADRHYLKIDFDPSGGDNYTRMGIMQLLSVPYALHANTVEIDNVDDADADATNEIQTISISGTVLTLSKNGGSVTMPTSGGGDNWGTQHVETDGSISGEGTPASPLSVNGDLTDDQMLSIAGNDLTISGGNTVSIPTNGDNWGIQTTQTDVSLSGEGITTNPLKIARQGATTGQILGWDGNGWKPKDDKVMDADADAANELQTLSLSGTLLSLSNGGGTVTLPSSGGGDNWGTQSVNTDNSLTGKGISTDPLKLAQQSATLGQILKWNGSSWSPSDQSGGTADGDAWGVTGEDQASVISRTGNVGIGTSNPLSKLSVGDEGNSNSVISGVANQWGKNAFYGESLSPSGYGKGGHFVTNGDEGIGVFGSSNSQTGHTVGGYFTSNSNDGKGVYGYGGKMGINGYSFGSNGIGVYGEADTLSFNSHGGYFISKGGGGRGVYGFGDQIGVHGRSNRGNAGVFNNGNNIKIAVYLAGSNYAMIIRDGSEAEGKVLTSNDTGYATWKTPSSSSDGDAWGVTGEDQSGIISRTGNVGIGTSNPLSKLDVMEEGSSKTAISGTNLYEGGVGVTGINSSSQGCGFGGLFKSSSRDGIGVMGIEESLIGNNYGGWFSSNSVSGIGVIGLSASIGIKGVSSTSGWAGFFENNGNNKNKIYLGGSDEALKIEDGNQGEGKVLTSDINGNASWQDPVAGSGDNWGNQVVVSGSSLIGNGTLALPLHVNGDLTDDQTLSISGNDLTISGGNTVTLPVASGGDGDAWGVTGEDQSGNIGRTGKVGVGITSPGYLMHVSGEEPAGGVGYFNNSATSGDQYGVWGECAGADYHGFGGYFRGGYGGILAQVQPIGGNSYMGVYAQANGGSGTNYGIRAQASGNGTNYGVYGEASGGSNNYGVYCSGNGVYTGTWSHSSDLKLKRNLEMVDGALGKVMQLQPTYFNYRNEEFPQLNLPEKRQVGFIAQELEEVLPDLVGQAFYTNSDDKYAEKLEYKTVDYISIVPILTGAIKELKNQMDEKQTELDMLKKENEQVKKEMAQINSRLSELEQLFASQVNNN